MNILDDVITYVRRIIKFPSNSSIKDALIVDYINRFWLNDVDARIQLFDLKKTYSFQTTPGIDKYNMPLYDIQTELGGQSISFYPVYQGFTSPCYINGVDVTLQTQKHLFYNVYPNVQQNLYQVGVGNGSVGPYRLQIPFLGQVPTPINPPVSALVRGHVDMSGIIAKGVNVDPPLVSNLEIINETDFIEEVPVTSVTPAIYFTSIAADGSNNIVCDSGQFLEVDQNYGLLMEPGKAPFGNKKLINAPLPIYSVNTNTINYLTGIAENVYFPKPIPIGAQIGAQFLYLQTGLPRTMLFYDNVLTLRSPPDKQYLVQLDGYLSPAAFLTTSDAIQFGYMSEYIARGAARKILSDNGDLEQFAFYEDLFREQEMLVWKRSQRQFTSTRTETIYSQGLNAGQSGFNSLGGTTV